jgi:dihydrofolate reductase
MFVEEQLTDNRSPAARPLSARWEKARYVTGKLSLIVAMSRNGVIGRDNRLPWRLSSDLKRFRALTMGHHIVMGRKTYESLGRLLPGRTSVVVTRNAHFRAPGAVVVNSLEAALDACARDHDIFVIGGAEIFREVVQRADRIYLTVVEADVDGDVYFPDIDWSAWREVSRQSYGAAEHDEYPHQFVIYDRQLGTDGNP